MKHFFISFTLVLILASCSPAKAEIPTTAPLTPTSTIISPSQTNSPQPTATTTATDTPEPLPSATIAPTATEEAVLHLSDIEGQATPEQIVELIRNGETLIPADALTDEFLDAYLQAMNYNYLTGEKVQEITVEQFEALKTNLGYMEYDANIEIYWFLAIAHNKVTFNQDIQIFKDPALSHLYANGLQRFSWLDEETGKIKTVLGLISTQNYKYPRNGETFSALSVAGLALIKDNESLQKSQATIISNTLVSELGITDGDIVMFGVNPNGNKNEYPSTISYRYFNDPILNAMYPEWETQALPALINGDTNLVPIVVLSELSDVAGANQNIFN